MEKLRLEFKKGIVNEGKFKEYISDISAVFTSELIKRNDIKDKSKLHYKLVVEAVIIDYFDYYFQEIINSTQIASDYKKAKKEFKSNSNVYNKLTFLCDKMNIDEEKLLLSIKKEFKEYTIEKHILFIFEKIKNINKIYPLNFNDPENRFYDKIDDELISYYDKPSHFSIVIILIIVRYINNKLIEKYKNNSSIIIQYDKDDYTSTYTFYEVTVLKPIHFNKKAGYNLDAFLDKLYDKLINKNLQVINEELTSRDEFIYFFTTDNLSDFDGAIYFNVDRYQMLYILLEIIGKKFDGNYEKTLFSSKKIFKKPISNSSPLPLTQRDINDYRKLPKEYRVKNQYMYENINLRE